MPAPSFTSESFAHDDKLFAGDLPRVTDSITVLSGQNVVKGALLGRVLTGTATASAVTGTGAGTLTMDATTPKLGGVKVGVYTVRCVQAVSAGGVFEVIDPDGLSIGNAVTGTAFANHLKFVIADGNPDFAVGDFFTITVAAGSMKYVLSLAAAVDGSELPELLTAEAIDATSADTIGPAYRTGEFNSAGITFGTGHTAASVADRLRLLGMHLKSVVAQT